MSNKDLRSNFAVEHEQHSQQRGHSSQGSKPPPPRQPASQPAEARKQEKKAAAEPNKATKRLGHPEARKWGIKPLLALPSPLQKVSVVAGTPVPEKITQATCFTRTWTPFRRIYKIPQGCRSKWRACATCAAGVSTRRATCI
eukprot:6851869-Prymnesium_polylepis.1